MITPQELTTKEQSKTLNTEELLAIKELEDHIDDELKSNFTRGFASITDWKGAWNTPGLKKFASLKSVRQTILTEIILEKYRDHGWIITYEFGEDDGPNRPGIESYYFKTK